MHVQGELLRELERQDLSRFNEVLRCCRHISVTRSKAQEKRVLIRLSCLQQGAAEPGLPACVL